MGGGEMEEPLRFTGNWFIDAGILGFVNLMEEVYGWDLEELQRRIKEEPEKVYYGYFPLAYFYNLPQSNKDMMVLFQAIKDIESFEGDKQELLKLVWWKYITQLFTDAWIKKKLGVMHEKDLKNKSGKVKDPYNDSGYVELVKKREELLNVALKLEIKDKSSKKSCGELIGKLIGKRRDIHELNLKDFEKLLELFSKSSNSLNELPEDCKTKIQEAIQVHNELKEYLTSQWLALKNVPYGEANTREVKGKSRYFRIPIDSGFYKNFMFFNNSKGIFEQLEDLKNLIDGNVEYTEYLQKIDKTLSKFLPSDSEFPNVHYTLIRVEPLLRHVPRLFVYLLNFLNAFTFVSGVGNVFFYGSTLDFTYHVNKRLKVLIAQAQEKQSQSMFKITWQAIIDVLVEGKTKWSLENMYLIQFTGIKQQALVNVEYIGIPKLHASIILDDNIRDAINTSLPVGDSNVWLLSEFIKQKPLYPLISKHLWNAVKKNGFLNWRASLYALAIDSKLRKEGTPGAIFDQAFFDRPKRAAVEVKDFYKEMIYVATVIKEVSPEISGKNLIHPLFSALRRHNRNAFVNTLLKALLQARSKDKVTTINNYLFRRILNNDTSWEDFALALIVGLIGGGEDAGSEQGVVED
ncbi:hypothetical protein VFC49_00470 [Thermococcus sp. SY098]|uniref:hypothetical protein n=1 Tax=Thermococcus sp. SY098 TaxID=3111325 RepID=UPI002D7A28FC|nr:hypothetical protein [Thermococcus sp. SY098]WRS52684.1 hypothetical protein VFC49_00470 [Thermococcus sp. SY098]